MGFIPTLHFIFRDAFLEFFHIQIPEGVSIFRGYVGFKKNIGLKSIGQKDRTYPGDCSSAIRSRVVMR
jgi:hypothetical protein